MSNPHAAALAQALKLADALIPCFPCQANKHPFPGSHAFKDATTDPEELRALWTRWPGVLIGVPTGEPSGLFVVDVDSVKHHEANDWLERHSPYLPDTRQHQTKSGGWHLLFQHRDGLRNTAGKLAVGVDTSGLWRLCRVVAGAYRVSLPSVHAVGTVPDWIVEALRKENRKQNQQPVDVNNGGRARARSAAPAPDRLQGIIATVANAREGERNQLTFWGACRINEMLAERKLDQSEGANAILILAEAASRSGLPPFEIKRTIKSAMQT